MKKISFVLAIFPITLLIVSCEKIKGKGDVITENRTVTGYSGIGLCLSGTVYYKQDSVYSLQIIAQQNILDRLVTEVEGNTLIIKMKPHVILGAHDPIRIYVTAPDVSSLDVSGSGDFYTENNWLGGDITADISGSGSINIAYLEANRFSAKVSGSGSINIAYLEANRFSAKVSGSGSIRTLGGKVTEEDPKISGSGDIDQQNVVCDNVYTSTSGSGETYVNAQKWLDVNISGSGDVYYYGNPTIEVRISGSGSLKKL